MTGPGEPWDSGLQNERTTLAWNRSALSFLAAGTLVGKQTGSSAGFATVMLTSVIVAAVMIARAGRRYHHRFERLHAGDPVVSPRAMAATATATVALSILGVVIVAI